jgi:hypothetical protein
MKSLFLIFLTIFLPSFCLLGQDIREPKEIQYIVNDELTTIWIDELEGNITNQELIALKEPVKNRHLVNIVDTLIHLSKNNSQILIYKTYNKIILNSALIKDKSIGIGNYLKIGITKSQFLKKTGIEMLSNKVRIGYLEGLQYFEFNFENKVLVSIKYFGNID